MGTLSNSFTVKDFASAKLLRSITDETKVTESGIYYYVPGKRFQCWWVQVRPIGGGVSDYERQVVASIPEKLVEIEKKQGNVKELWDFALMHITNYSKRHGK